MEVTKEDSTKMCRSFVSSTTVSRSAGRGAIAVVAVAVVVVVVSVPRTCTRMVLITLDCGTNSLQYISFVVLANYHVTM